MANTPWIEYCRERQEHLDKVAEDNEFREQWLPAYPNFISYNEEVEDGS